MKKKVSRFEYAIMEAANDPRLTNYEPYTEAEEYQQRRDNIEKKFNRLKPLNPNA